MNLVHGKPAETLLAEVSELRRDAGFGGLCCFGDLLERSAFSVEHEVSDSCVLRGEPSVIAVWLVVRAVEEFELFLHGLFG